ARSCSGRLLPPGGLLGFLRIAFLVLAIVAAGFAGLGFVSPLFVFTVSRLPRLVSAALVFLVPLFHVLVVLVALPSAGSRSAQAGLRSTARLRWGFLLRLGRARPAVLLLIVLGNLAFIRHVFTPLHNEEAPLVRGAVDERDFLDDDVAEPVHFA